MVMPDRSIFNGRRSAAAQNSATGTDSYVSQINTELATLQAQVNMLLAELSCIRQNPSTHEHHCDFRTPEQKHQDNVRDMKDLLRGQIKQLQEEIAIEKKIANET